MTPSLEPGVTMCDVVVWCRNGASSAQKAAVAPLSQLPPQIQKQLLPPPPPPQPGAPDEWRNNQPPELMNQGERVEQPVPQGDNRAANGTRQERPTFNHYSSKPQLYNANMPFHMQGLGAYPPPPPPPPPGPTPPMAGQFPFYQQPPATSQYPYFMMHHQQ
ncbi:hypothetical protein J6590_058574 [Homalodisca vitripennis]|nr:hypothetical protein J6590_058574 [Homalodisca vitripennis]